MRKDGSSFTVVKKRSINIGGIVLDKQLEQDIRESLVEGKLPCAVAFSIAKKHGVAPKIVGDAANELKIKIASCQLGCFP